MSISHFRFSRNHLFYENLIYKLVLPRTSDVVVPNFHVYNRILDLSHQFKRRPKG